MDCRECVYMKRFRRMSGGKPYCVCGHKKAEGLPVEIFGTKEPRFICLVDDEGEPRIKSHPRWCPLRGENLKKGQYVAEWDKSKGKIALKFKEDKDGKARAGGDQPD